MPHLGLVVPGLQLGGGVPAVARFIKNAALRSGNFALKLVSISMDSRDPCSLNLRSPRSWIRGVTTSTGEWEGLPFTHVGCTFGELEFQRYKPRSVLTDVVSDCDVVQVVCGSPAWANAVCGLGKPVSLQVATRARVERRERDRNARGPAGLWRRSMTTITDRLDDCALRRADAIQVENPWMLDYARGINSGRDVDIRYAPPGVDARMFYPAPSRDRETESYILCVGRLGDPRKNVGLLVEAYARLPAMLRNRTRLVFAGAGSPPQALWERADALDVRFRIDVFEHPDMSALIKLYQQAAVSVLPSDEEGFGMVVIEAMACGVPVVATRCGGPDGIIADGEDGFLVPRDDPAAMADRLARLLGDPSLNAAMGANARATAERCYDERVAGTAFIDVWQRLLHEQDRH